jgi:TM2 domain-containing membrane protein YozV
VLQPGRLVSVLTDSGVIALSTQEASFNARTPIAGLLAWILPGLGHFYLGHHARGLVFLVTIMVTFWSGVAIGGAASTVNPHERKLWFVAQIFTGGNTLAAYGLTARVRQDFSTSGQPYVPRCWISADVGVHYTGVAGLLNLLIILDAIGRSDSSYTVRRSRRESPEGAP